MTSQWTWTYLDVVRVARLVLEVHEVGGGAPARVSQGQVHHGRGGMPVTESLQGRVPQVDGVDDGLVPVRVLVADRREKLV